MHVSTNPLVSVVMLTNADAGSLHDRLERQSEYLAANQVVAVVSCASEWIDSRGRVLLACALIKRGRTDSWRS